MIYKLYIYYINLSPFPIVSFCDSSSSLRYHTICCIDFRKFKGYLVGKAEIIQINFLTKNQAIEGRTRNPTATPYGKNKVAKIYKSQISILERAETILNNIK